MIPLGSRRDMVAPIWEGITLIPDEITKAANGQIVVTAVMLHAVNCSAPLVFGSSKRKSLKGAPWRRNGASAVAWKFVNVEVGGR